MSMGSQRQQQTNQRINSISQSTNFENVQQR
jgi:hypothetical protein